MTTIALQSAFNTTTGYGNDGIGMVDSMLKQGHELTLLPVSLMPPVSQAVAHLLTKMPPPHVNTAVSHVDPFSVWHIKNRGLKRGSDKLIWWSMWEFATFEPPEWKDRAQEIDEIDLFLAYDEVTLEALTPLLPPHAETAILQGGHDFSDVEYMPRDWDSDDVFRYCMVGQLNTRKNPFAAINAFRILKQRHGDAFNAELHLKTTVRTLHPGIEEAYPGVKIHYEVWPREQLLEFYRSCHCYLAPSYGEGKNIPAMEAAVTGMAVAATEFGGHKGWLREDYGYWIPYERMHTFPDVGQGAEVDPEPLAEVMWDIYTHRQEARLKGALASRTLPSMMSWDSVVRRLGEHL